MANLCIRLALGLSLLFGAAASAQEFVFVSDRLPTGEDHLFQNDLFLYRDGSQIRLTFTPGEIEWDPSPSPSGRYLAYMVEDTLTDWAATEIRYEWNWLLRIMDLDSLRVVDEWRLPGDAGVWRPAGGLAIAWSQQEDWLLVQLPDMVGPGMIGLVERGNPEVGVIGSGFGISLQEGGQLFGTTLEGVATVHDLASGQQHGIRIGEHRGLLGNSFVIGGPDGLYLYDPETGSERVLSDVPGYYPSFASNREGTRHAWLRYDDGWDGTHVTVIDDALERVTSWDHAARLTSLEFLDEHTLLVEAVVQASQIHSLDTRTYVETQLVSTVGFHNRTPATLPTGR